MRPPSYQAVVAMAKLAGFRFEEKWEGAHHKVIVWQHVENNSWVTVATMTRFSEGKWWWSYSLGQRGERVRSKGRLAMQILQRLIEEKENRP